MSVQPAGGRKDDYGKPRIDLIPAYILLLLGRVLAYGASRYGDNNWKNVPNARDRYYAAAQRHLLLWRSGELLDSGEGGSGLPHLIHAIACIMFLLAFDLGLDKEAQ